MSTTLPNYKSLNNMYIWKSEVVKATSIISFTDILTVLVETRYLNKKVLISESEKYVSKPGKYLYDPAYFSFTKFGCVLNPKHYQN